MTLIQMMKRWKLKQRRTITSDFQGDPIVWSFKIVMTKSSPSNKRQSTVTVLQIERFDETAWALSDSRPKLGYISVYMCLRTLFMRNFIIMSS